MVESKNYMCIWDNVTVYSAIDTKFLEVELWLTRALL